MAYVPNLPEAKSPNPLAGPQAQQPSQTNLMMAMAQMHQLGKFGATGTGQARQTTPSRNLKTLPYNRKLSPLKTQR